MTKTLTENRWFYTENGIKDASWHIVFKSEVLAPVPSYNEYKRLREQLNEANKVITHYAEKNGYKKATDYLNKWGVK